MVEDQRSSILDIRKRGLLWIPPSVHLSAFGITLNPLAYICTSTGYQVPALAAFKGTGWMDVARCTKVRFDRPRWSLSSPSAFA